METAMIVRIVLLSFSIVFLGASAILFVLSNKNKEWEYGGKLFEIGVLCLVVGSCLNIANVCIGLFA